LAERQWALTLRQSPATRERLVRLNGRAGSDHENSLGLHRQSKQVGDVNQLHAFASREDADRWPNEFDAEGVAFDYPVFGREAAN
jgi:hypothetical protein